MTIEETKEYYGFKVASDDWSKRKLTKERAMAIIDLFKSQLERDCEWERAFRMALKSLEAWEKVKEEVEDKIGSLDDELKNGVVCLSYYYGKLAGLSERLEIIDKYLAEVEIENR